uniref:Latent-transforming growth factor beta-binding protein 1 n=1 Tax=Oncorhynchus kisutch TaxID=8019 RepID=A0A8C7KTA7_ONCKI
KVRERNKKREGGGQRNQGRLYRHAHSLLTRLSLPSLFFLMVCCASRLAVGNHTGRIKVVFTPTICKVTCTGGRCQNNCELGNTTTIVSENGHAADTLTAPNFRVVVCHLPCMNGGKCSARDKCQCPPTFTGKFCQMPVQNGNGQQRQNGQQQTSQIHSTHTLPLTFSNGQNPVKYAPSIVNIHVKHPPEASVQIHQVSQLDANGQKVKGNGQNGHSQTHLSLPSPFLYFSLSFSLSLSFSSKCQCGKALPGLSKQEECCQSIGTSWGFHKCQKCPKPCKYQCKTNLNECQLQGVCPNGDCLNTMGSYRCSCKAGFIPDPTLSTCIPDTPAVHEEKGACFRLVSSGKQCLHPVPAQLSKQLCCCSVGKAWGPRCDKCPLPGTGKVPNAGTSDMSLSKLTHVPSHDSCLATDVDECLESASLCSNGRCRNTPGSFLCVCQPGFMTDEEGTSCIDIDECLDMGVCPSGMCVNLLGSYECDSCPDGFQGQGGQCVDVDECLHQSTCANGKCSNFEGYFVCSCNDGFTLSLDGQSCEGNTLILVLYDVMGLSSDNSKLFCPNSAVCCAPDVDECQDEQVCTRGHCQNTVGSYLCNCGPGFRASPAGDQCDDVDECQELTMPCDRVGQCVNNMGSYHCSCPQGYQQINGTSCLDVDECLDDPELCSPHGECLNAEGSFYCVCERGFAAGQDTHTYMDECSDDTRCVGGSCENSQGSYRCQCDTGYRLQPDTDTCLDIDECAELGQNICGAWLCENTEGSYRCVVDCPPGHDRGPEGICVDIDECNVNATVCGNHGFCENTVGSFRCLCDRGYQESQEGLGCVDVNECELLSGVCGEALCENVEGSFLCMCPDEDQEYNQMTAKCSPAPTASSVERKECYYNLNDENLCENVLTSSVTMEECCCTLGAGWGDNCEVHPCPVQDQFSQMCPAGRGNVPTGDAVFGVTAAESYKDADECALFGQEICKDGFCLNSPGSYECYCKTGLYYDEVKLQCRDIDECQDESSCVGGECLNTQGSYMCFCTRPMVLDSDNKRCVIAPEVAEQHSVQTDYQGICWQTVTGTRKTCTKPLANRKTTFTECCCLHGEAWGMDCALCPLKNTEDYASMCNVPMREGQGHPYGRDALVAEPVQEYEVNLDYEPRPDQPGLIPCPRPAVAYDAFEGLRAEECGILNGCENGRCVRVQEGYTCDCFDGYTLDMSRMACVDVNECSELNNRMSLCKNAKCINTEGSYKCVCLPGYTPSEQPNYCVAREPEAAAAAHTERE